ncbi:glutathione S-transferase family protein [Alginatibacterium sediminis]|uniref:Glutathione S-transferase family protein n=1 Tax=Alginatibacterium sediminis TaxID=2164068 RepID=A0A420EHH2_9ALTE|nr:glutathione S-transferase family protein [Alginatibacterium sediminis]RKF20191.1 glutathione S-transferase family protein [Alginatibacterium sediminis]
MGLLIQGKWHDQWYNTEENKGHFKRSESQFRNWVTEDGSAGPSGIAGFKAEVGRYHLYVSHACPWANRAMIFRQLKGLEQVIDYSVVHWRMQDQGWTFEDGDGVIPDPINNAELLHQVYTAADSQYTGRVTVPILWDKQQQTIVSNESSEIIRMFNSAFNKAGANALDFYPLGLREQIDAINERVYSDINNGVYKCGFATSQDAYEASLSALFTSLDWLEEKLSSQRYLCGNQLTEADWRLFTTLVRFDSVYVGHFKCNLKRIADYPNLQAYLCDLYQHANVSETVNMDHIKKHYYISHTMINPSQVVPQGPFLDFSVKHGRDTM